MVRTQHESYPLNKLLRIQVVAVDCRYSAVQQSLA